MFQRHSGTVAEGVEAPSGSRSTEERVLAEQVRLLYCRAFIAQATVVLNGAVVTWIFWRLVPPARSLAWAGALCALAALRVALVVAYRRRPASADSSTWARRFAGGAALTGIAWGAAALVFDAPASPAHEVFLAFVLGGMTAGAASSNASYPPAFVAFAAPALVPMVAKLVAAGDEAHLAMAFMLALFGVSVGGISRTGHRAIEDAIRLRFRNEALVEEVVAAERRLEALNADLERQVADRTAELARIVSTAVASEARVAAILRSIGDAVVATDAAGKVTLTNGVAEALTGWDAERAIGTPVGEVLRVLDEGSRAPAELPLRLVLDGAASVVRGDRLLVARDGGERPVAITAAPLRQAGGSIVGVVLAFRDQTAARRAEEALHRTHEALREADRRKDHFIAVLSHELRNPLASMRNSLYTLERAPPDAPGFGRARDICRRQTEHLARLVDDLLDVTRISRGKIQLRRARISARDVVSREAADLRPVFDARGLALRVEASDAAWIDADETRIAQVVGNLLQNAAKFSRAGGAVTVGVATDGETVRMSVRDEGVGIAPDLLPRMFEPFVQAADGSGASAGGLGLGLALVKGLVELHGGTVAACSEGPRRGSEFVVSLPAAPPPAAAEPAWPASPA